MTTRTETLTDSQFAKQLNAIQEMTSLENLLEYLRQLKAVKTALESVGAFKTQAVKYARLHAEALIRVVELGGINGLKSKRDKATALWLEKMPTDEREKFINMCAEGILITEIYRREVEIRDGIKEELRKNRDYRQATIDELEETGIVDFDAFSSIVRASLRPFGQLQLAEDFIDGTRNDLRKIGGVNARLEPNENSTNVYVLPGKGNKNQQLDALAIRLFNIGSAMRSFENLINATGIEIEELLGHVYETRIRYIDCYRVLFQIFDFAAKNADACCYHKEWRFGPSEKYKNRKEAINE